MASPLVTFLENYHWKGYTVDTIVNNSNTMMCLHRGNFPMHRYCKNTEIGCVPFNLLEAWVWVHMEKWNILWADDDTWLPQDANVLTRDRLPHGFHKVIINETDEDYLQVWVSSRTGFLSICSGKSPLRLCLLGKFTPFCHRSTKRPTMCHYSRSYARLQFAGEPHRSLCPPGRRNCPHGPCQNQ